MNKLRTIYFTAMATFIPAVILTALGYNAHRSVPVLLGITGAGLIYLTIRGAWRKS